jgi:hypothetical protein
MRKKFLNIFFLMLVSGIYSFPVSAAENISYERIAFGFGFEFGEEKEFSVFCPSGVSIPHDLHDSIEEHTMDWALDCGLVKDNEEKEKLKRADFSYLGVNSSQVVEDINHLKLINDFLHYFFSHDNFMESDDMESDDIVLSNHIKHVKYSNEVYINIWNSTGNFVEETNNVPYVKCVCDLRDRLRKTGCDISRFISSLQVYYTATRESVRERLDKKNLNEDEVINRRIKAGGLDVMIELALSLADSLKYYPTSEIAEKLDKMSVLTTKIVTFENDIASYRKEEKQRNVYENLLFFREGYFNEEPSVAYFYTLNLINKAIEEFWELKTSLLGIEDKWGDASNFINKKITLMECWLRYNVTWSLFTSRYNIEGSSGRTPVGE